MIVTSLGARAIGVAGTLVITRFLSEELVGQTAVASIMAFTFGWFTTWGFGQYAVVFGRGEQATEVTWHATVAYNVLGLVALGLLLVLGGPIARLIGVPAAAPFVPGLALAVFVKRLGAMPERVLARRLQFRAIGIAAAAGEITYAITAVSLAIRGWGGDAVVYGNIAQSTITLLLLVRASGTTEWLTPVRLRWERFRDMLRFGVPLAVQGIAHMAGRYWDKPVVAYLFGDGAAGRYSLAYSLADIPAIYIGEQLALVLLPSMASLPPERRPRALERATALLSLIIFPLAIGLGLVAAPLIALMLTPQWQGVAPLLTVLTVLSVFRPITWVLSAYMEAQDRTTRLMVLEIVKLVMLLGGFFALHSFGPRWAATSVGIAYGLNAIAGVWLVSYEGPSPRKLAAGFLRPLLACAAMAGAVLGLRHVLDGTSVPLVVQLGLEIGAGAIAYVAAAFVFCRPTAQDLVQLVKGVVRRRRGGAEEAAP
jgi:PST family polysaccharide transporter